MAVSLAKVNTRTLIGIDAVATNVEVHLANGLPAFAIVGLPETSVRESKDRVRSAIINSGFEFPAKRITVNLSPADLPKQGSRFDLPIAIAILLASKQIHSEAVENYEFVGELGLDGLCHAVEGILPTAVACKESKRALIVPENNRDEAAVVGDCQFLAAENLLAVCYHLAGQKELSECVSDDIALQDKSPDYPDLKDVKGQPQARRVLEIAASGAHSLLMSGPPGTGKSMLAERLPGILPQLDMHEALETAAIQSVVRGRFNVHTWRQRPFRAPHHSASSVALVGGGTYPQPGEISLAHQGVLFLDELPEFSRATLEQLREPIESGVIHIARAKQKVSFPAKFMLLSACNPCPCGYLGDGTDRCRCSAVKIDNYRSKLSGPMLDRIDLHIHLPRVDTLTLQRTDKVEEGSEQIRQRVTQARKIQKRRQGVLNSELTTAQLNEICSLDSATSQFLQLASERLMLSARAYHRVLKVARTIADMKAESSIDKSHVAEAIGYRGLDRQ